MAQVLNLKVTGLATHPNALSEVKEGALVIANNIVIDKESVAESRRGFKKYGNELGGSTGKFENIYNYNNRLICSYYDSGTTNYKMGYDDSNNAGSWSSYSGTYTPPTDFKIRGIETNKNFYFNTQAGVYKLDSITGTPTLAGVPASLDGEATTSSGSAIDANSSVAYRLVLGIRDANNNLILGPPSSRVPYYNSGTATDLTLTFNIPSGLTTSHFYQLYRTQAFDCSITYVEPDDEMQLVYEANLSASDISNKYITIVDSTPAALRGATLYASPSQQGISNSKYSPPYCKDMTIFKNSVLYANTVSKHRYYLTLIAVSKSGSAGLRDGDTLTVGSVTYTAASGSVTATGYAANIFQVMSADDAATNIDATAKNIVKVINLSSTNTGQYAYYISGYSDLPGKIMIEERGINGSSFALTSSRGSSFSPVLPVNGVTQSSTNDTAPNRVYVSLVMEPEAVPLLNYLNVGSSNSAVKRIVALRESVFVFKDDGKIFRITGEDFASFTLTLMENNTKLVAPESAVVFNNQVWCFTTQGVCAVADNGVAVMSRAIERDLIQYISPLYPAMATTTWGCAYDSERKYLLGIVTSKDDLYATQIYVYNTFTNSWVRWIKNAACALTNGRDDKLYLGGINGYCYQERKNLNREDYSEDELSVTISSQPTSTTLVLNSVTGISVNDSIKQGSNTIYTANIVSYTGLQLTLDSVTNVQLGYTIKQTTNSGTYDAVVTAIDVPNKIVSVTNSVTWELGAIQIISAIITGYITAINVGTNTVTLRNAQSFNTAAATVYKPIACSLKWVPQSTTNAGILKHFRDAKILFRDAVFKYIDIGFETDFSGGTSYTTVTPNDVGAWGMFEWGLLPWGGGSSLLQAIRTYIPREKARGHWINVSIYSNEAFTSFSVSGASLMFEEVGERMR